MRKSQTDLTLNRLGDGLRTAFQWVVERNRAGEVADLADAWAGIASGGLNGLRLMSPPRVDRMEPFLPFIKAHRIRAESFYVGRSGMGGGPPVDLLLQVWLDTEDGVGGFGVPMIIREIPSFGPMPEPLWLELHDTCRKLNVVSPATKLVMVAAEEDFDWGEQAFERRHKVIIWNAHWFAGLHRPPRPAFGRTLESFCIDLASGWVGDPLLSGRPPSPVLDELLSNYHVGNLVRIRIEIDEGRE